MEVSLVELRESPWPRLGWTMLVIFLAVLLFVLWPRTQDYRVAAECRERYRAARTGKDSASIDHIVIVGTKSEAAHPVSCGMLRRQRRL